MPTGRFWRMPEFLCIIGIGTSSLKRLQEISDAGEDAFKEWKIAFFNRMANVNVVSALILSSTTAFVTTSPPTGMLRWDLAIPYILLLVTIFLGVVGVGLGLAIMFILSDIQPAFVQTLAEHRIKSRATICFLAMPVLLGLGSGMTAAVALFSAAWLGDNTGVKVVATTAITIVGLTILILIFFVRI